MSGHYAQATSEESTEMVTNRASVNPQHWNTGFASYEVPSFGSQSSANLASNFSNLYLSSNNTGSAFAAPAASQYSGSMNVHSENRVSQNADITETQRAAVPDQHLR